MIKTKAGEISALSNLHATRKDRVEPVFHVTTSVAPSFVPALSNIWSGRRLAVDGRFSFNTTASTAQFNAVLRGLRNASVPAIPSISTSADPRLVAAAKALVNQDGLVVRSALADMPSAAAWIAGQGWSPVDVDLVVDVGHVAALPIALLGQMVTTSLGTNIGSTSPYRSVTLAAAAAPRDHGDLPRGPSTIARRDFELWGIAYPTVNFELHYGDYCTGHPDLTEPPGPAMAKATVSARYTCDTHWLIIKGRPITGSNGIPMAAQYRSHAGVYVADPGFGGVQNCWGDDRIAQIHSGTTTSGNRQTWSEIAANRHMSHVIDRLP